MSGGLPGFTTTSITEKEPNKLRGKALIEGPPITLDASEINVDLAAPYRLPKGRVVVKAASGGLYLLANGTSGTRQAGTKAVLTSEEAADGDWDSTVLTLYRNGVQVAQVTLGTTLVTSAVVTALNGDSDFADHAVASGTDGNPLVITAKAGGEGEGLRVHQDLRTAWGADLGATAGASEASAHGTSPDFRVTLEEVDLKDTSHEDLDAPVANALRGVFDTSELVGLTSEARAVLERRGSIFL